MTPGWSSYAVTKESRNRRQCVTERIATASNDVVTQNISVKAFITRFLDDVGILWTTVDLI